MPINVHYGQGPHWGAVRKKMPPGKVYLSHCHVYYRRFIYLYDDFDYQIIIKVLQQE